MKHLFLIQKTLSWSPRFKQALKNVIVEADDYEQANRILMERYFDWSVSMYWPIVKDWKKHPDITYAYINLQYRD